MSSSHNERIKCAYGNYNFWAWFRYWYLDSCAKVEMILSDRAYYDYDYEQVDKSKIIVDWEDTIKSDEEVNNILSIFGMGNKQTPEEQLQSYIIKEEQKKCQ